MKADSASHLIRQPINFELFLFLYLVCALLLQKINIYKTNYHRIDLNLVVFIIVILSRRLTWCVLQEIQSHWKPKPVVKSGAWQGAKSRSSKAGGGWDMFLWNWSLNLKRSVIVLCTVPAVVWSILHLIQNTPIFNLLFLVYPLLLYFSLFGFTLEPRCYRGRYKPPRTFLQHIDFSAPSRQQFFSPDRFASSSSTSNTGHAHNNLPGKMDQDSGNHLWATPTAGITPPSSSSSNSGIHNKNVASAAGAQSSMHQNGPSSLHHRHQHQPSNPIRKVTSALTNLKMKATQNHVIGSIPHGHHRDRLGTGTTTSSSSCAVEGTSSSTQAEGCGQGSGSLVPRHSPEHALLLPSTPDEVREEVDLLLSDLIVRLKQLLFNSLLCAYYVGFIPVQFADSHLYYDKWWCVEHGFLVWANSFVILASHLLPPSYCQVLYQCSLHLGCWTRVLHDESAKIWSPDVIWLRDKVVQWNSESFKAEGPQNVAIPCDSSQEAFYLLFHSRLHVHTWLLTMQCITVAFQMVVLLRSVFWFQTLSMSIFLLFNYFILYKLLYNRLMCRRSVSLS